MVNKWSKLFLVLLVIIREIAGDKRLILDGDENVMQRLTSLEQEVQSVKSELAAKDQIITNLQQQKADVGALGSTFVRWGRTICDGNSSQLVYYGYAAGTHYGESGNGANIICLPEHPTWAQSQDGYVGAHIFGAEYDHKFNTFNFNFYEDMPCAVCRTHLPTTIMIPASTNCSTGWTMQHTGYLMSSHYNRVHPTEYICVDGHPEYIYRGEGDLPGPEFYVVQAKCGVLPCRDYPDGKELACSVCSK